MLHSGNRKQISISEGHVELDPPFFVSFQRISYDIEWAYDLYTTDLHRSEGHQRSKMLDELHDKLEQV